MADSAPGKEAIWFPVATFQNPEQIAIRIRGEMTGAVDDIRSFAEKFAGFYLPYVQAPGVIFVSLRSLDVALAVCERRLSPLGGGAVALCRGATFVQQIDEEQQEEFRPLCENVPGSRKIPLIHQHFVVGLLLADR